MDGRALSIASQEAGQPAPTVTKEQWNQLLQTKKDFYTHKTSNLKGCPCLPPEIAESWFRSREYQVDPNNPFSGRTLSHSELQEIMRQNSAAVRIAAPLFKSFHKTRHCSEFHLHLLDKNGVILLQEGFLFKDFANKAKTIFQEEYLGTNADVICNMSKKPVVMFGPQHYNNFIDNVLVMAAPIFDSNGAVIYDLILSLRLNVLPWDKNYQDVYSPTYSLIVAMAVAIETKLKQEISYAYLELMNEHFKLLSESYEKNQSARGIITIDSLGKIINASPCISSVMNIDKSLLLDKNIAEFTNSKPRLLDMVNHGRDANTSELFSFGDKQSPYFLNIHPVKNQWSTKILGAVLTLDGSSHSPVVLETKTKNTLEFSQLIGESPAFQKAINMGQAFACSNDNILLTGESGTGKELFAQAIHSQYQPDGPFVAINCAAMPRELIESELFGYERGSFTGADRCGRPGKIEQADGGTLFLDEIGDMNLDLQAVLLRVLQDKQVIRVGGRQAKTVNFRLIAATNKNLKELVGRQLFREDLYYRLSVLTIDLPPLRARQEDIPLLCRHFLTTYCHKKGISQPQIRPQAQEKLNVYKWPGNIRQLENAIIYAINSVQGADIIGIRNLPESIILDEDPKTTPEKTETDVTENRTAHTMRDSEKHAILRSLTDAQYNVIQAAKILGISKSTLYRKIKKYNIQF